MNFSREIQQEISNAIDVGVDFGVSGRDASDNSYEALQKVKDQIVYLKSKQGIYDDSNAYKMLSNNLKIKRNSRKKPCVSCGVSGGVNHKIECTERERLIKLSHYKKVRLREAKDILKENLLLFIKDSNPDHKDFPIVMTYIHKYIKENL